MYDDHWNWKLDVGGFFYMLGMTHMCFLLLFSLIRAFDCDMTNIFSQNIFYLSYSTEFGKRDTFGSNLQIITQDLYQNLI